MGSKHKQNSSRDTLASMSQANPFPKVGVSMPTKGAMVVDLAFNRNSPTKMALDTRPTADDHANWYMLEDLSNVIKNQIYVLANDLHEQSQIIAQQGGVSNMADYEITVRAYSKDLERYTDEFAILEQEHIHRNGIIENPEDHALYLTIFEKYLALQAMIQGTSSHVQIKLTQYLLEIKDRIHGQQEAQQQAAVQPE